MSETRLQIKLLGEPILRKKAAAVSEVGQRQRDILSQMAQAMYASSGIGLAAPQVGINECMIVADIGSGLYKLVNPKIVMKSGRQVLEEGCLSIPGVHVVLKRPEKIWVKYTDENNQVVEQVFSDLMARVFLHENDHLFGKMIVDYLSAREKLELKEKLDEIKEFNKNSAGSTERH